MQKKRIVVALGHRALGTTLPEQKRATEKSARAVADLVEAGVNVVITHSNAPQVGMIHTAMNEAPSGLYGGPHVCLLCYEPGLYRI